MVQVDTERIVHARAALQTTGLGHRAAPGLVCRCIAPGATYIELTTPIYI